MIRKNGLHFPLIHQRDSDDERNGKGHEEVILPVPGGSGSYLSREGMDR